MYIKLTNGIPEKYTIGQLRRDNPQTSFPKSISNEVLAEFGVYPLQLTEHPPFDPNNQRVEEDMPVFIDGRWAQTWEVLDLTPDELAQTKQALIARFDQALSDHLDTTAQAKRYDNRITCSVRAGYPGPFQAEGQAFAVWMDNCNAQAYQMLAEIESGTRPMFASTDEFLAALPVMVWP